MSVPKFTFGIYPLSAAGTPFGWPPGPKVERSYERQREVLETVIRTIYNLCAELNITK